MHRLRLFSVASLAALALAVLGCGGSDEKYYIPADTELRPFTPPEQDELGGDDEADGEGDWSTEEPAAAGDAAPAAAPTAPAAVAPAAPAMPDKAARPSKAGKAARPEKPAAAKPGPESGSP